MKCITVCVGYDDLFKITLPLNKHHFTDYLVVTHHDDYHTCKLCAEHNIQCFSTNAFYEDNARFNKGKAMEEGFDVLGRDGWIMILDADTILPRTIDWSFLEIGKLYGPRRHLLDDHLSYTPDLNWKTLPIRPDHEFAGYCTIAHADDPVLKALEG